MCRSKYNTTQSCGPIGAQGPNRWRGKALKDVFAGYSGNVRLLPTHDIFLTRWASHSNAHGIHLAGAAPEMRSKNIDCTHYCWYSWLWEPLWERVAVLLLFG